MIKQPPNFLILDSEVFICVLCLVRKDDKESLRLYLCFWDASQSSWERRTWKFCATTVSTLWMVNSSFPKESQLLGLNYVRGVQPMARMSCLSKDNYECD